MCLFGSKQVNELAIILLYMLLPIWNVGSETEGLAMHQNLKSQIMWKV